MLLDDLLQQEHWDDYDNKKIRDKRDGNFFACSESWEVDYLVRVIKKRFPTINEEGVRLAIGVCCNSVPAPRPRRQFVECVLKRLGL